VFERAAVVNVAVIALRSSPADNWPKTALSVCGVSTGA